MSIFGTPKAPDLAPVPEIKAPEIDTTELARQRKELQSKRMGRSKLRIDPDAGINTDKSQSTGLML